VLRPPHRCDDEQRFVGDEVDEPLVKRFGVVDFGNALFCRWWNSTRFQRLPFAGRDWRERAQGSYECALFDCVALITGPLGRGTVDDRDTVAFGRHLVVFEAGVKRPAQNPTAEFGATGPPDRPAAVFAAQHGAKQRVDVGRGFIRHRVEEGLEHRFVPRRRQDEAHGTQYSSACFIVSAWDLTVSMLGADAREHVVNHGTADVVLHSPGHAPAK